MCCEGWLAINSNGIKASLHNPCVHSSCDIGCNIYSKRPIDPCINFECLWLTDALHVSDELKPSISKIILQEKLVQGWHLPVLTAVATDEKTLDFHWDNLKSIAKRKEIFALALAYSEKKYDKANKTMRIYGSATFGETMKQLFNNNTVIF